jgi:hypothetical protein
VKPENPSKGLVLKKGEGGLMIRMEEGVKTKPTQDSIKLLREILESDPELRKLSCVETHTMDWIRKQKPYLTEQEIREEYRFMQSGKIGNQDFDEAWGRWNWNRVRLEGILRSMLETKKFRREQVVKAELANLGMEYSLFEVIRKLFILYKNLNIHTEEYRLSFIDDLIMKKNQRKPSLKFNFDSPREYVS